MINNFFLFMFFTLMKFLLEDSFLSILMIIEALSMISFFCILILNLLMMGLGSSLLTFLTIQISESVLSLCFFVNLIRNSKSDKISSFFVSKL